MSKSNYLVSVITPDRVGLTRDIAQTIVDLHGYISDMRQTIVSGFFSLIFVTEHEKEVGAELKTSLEKILPEGAVLSLMPHPEKVKRAIPKTAARYVAIGSGEDRPGMMLAISKFMADHNINIEDWSTLFDGKHVTHLAYITFRCPCTDLKAMQEAFKTMMSENGFMAQICHEAIFRATGDVTPIKSIISQE
ncbi:MAG: ACT domain-containing protein [Kiritimatiellia bacterium]